MALTNPTARLGQISQDLFHDHNPNYLIFHGRFFAFGLAKAVVLVKSVRGVILFLDFKPDRAGGGKCGAACLEELAPNAVPLILRVNI